MKEKRKKLVILDAHAIIHRAYHGMPNFSTRSGIPTGAIYGFITMVLRIIEDFHPDYVVACYDLPGKTFRHESFSDYKGTRSKTDEELKLQFGPTRELCKIFSIPIYDYPGFEADDIIGTITKKLKDKDIDIIIASGDMDTLQLVDGDRVRVFTLKRGIRDTIIYNEKEVIKRYGFKPIFIIDYKAFKGDVSDNIPGIKGIGDKAATLLISNFQTLENVYSVLEREDGEEEFLKLGITKRMIKLIKEGKEEAEFSKVLATIRYDAPIDFNLPKKDWYSDINVEEALSFFKKYELRSLPDRLFKTLNIRGNHEMDKILKKREIENEKQVNEVQNNEIKIKLTAIALSLLDSEKTNASLEDILEYTGEQRFLNASKKIFDELKLLKKPFQLFNEIEKPLFEIVRIMEKKGILIDKKFFSKLSKEYHQELKKIEKNIFKMSGEEFNIKSPKQLGEILFKKMKLPTKGIKKSKNGDYTTNINTLEKLKDDYIIIQQILEYRELQKLLSTYIDVIPNMVGEDGRIHAEFIQNGTATGRFSSRNPNLQNIPTRTDLGRKIREGFIADIGKKLVSIDYSQIELRILALLSKDKGLTKIFKEKKDIHTSVAALIGGVDEKKVDREMRRKAKVVNFGILYGMGINSLKKEMGVTKEEAQKFYNGFFNHFPEATLFLEKTKQFARENGYTETLFGRRRQFKNINSSLPFIRAMAERMALNAPIQGTAADIIKLAMVQVNERIIKNFPSASLILQIHDEIIYEVGDSLIKEFLEQVVNIMENILENSYLNYKTDIPLVVHSFIGKNWGELK